MEETQYLNIGNNYRNDHYINNNQSNSKIIGYLIWKDRKYPIKDGANMIGKDSACDIQIQHNSICSKHAEIVIDIEDGLPYLRDLKSTSGTFLAYSSSSSSTNNSYFEKLNYSNNNRKVITHDCIIRLGLLDCYYQPSLSNANNNNKSNNITNNSWIAKSTEAHFETQLINTSNLFSNQSSSPSQQQHVPYLSPTVTEYTPYVLQTDNIKSRTVVEEDNISTQNEENDITDVFIEAYTHEQLTNNNEDVIMNPTSSSDIPNSAAGNNTNNLLYLNQVNDLLCSAEDPEDIIDNDDGSDSEISRDLICTSQQKTPPLSQQQGDNLTIASYHSNQQQQHSAHSGVELEYSNRTSRLNNLDDHTNLLIAYSPKLNAHSQKSMNLLFSQPFVPSIPLIATTTTTTTKIQSSIAIVLTKANRTEDDSLDKNNHTNSSSNTLPQIVLDTNTTEDTPNNNSYWKNISTTSKHSTTNKNTNTNNAITNNYTNNTIVNNNMSVDNDLLDTDVLATTSSTKQLVVSNSNNIYNNDNSNFDSIVDNETTNADILLLMIKDPIKEMIYSIDDHSNNILPSSPILTTTPTTTKEVEEQKYTTATSDSSKNNKHGTKQLESILSKRKKKDIEEINSSKLANNIFTSTTNNLKLKQPPTTPPTTTSSSSIIKPKTKQSHDNIKIDIPTLDTEEGVEDKYMNTISIKRMKTTKKGNIASVEELKNTTYKNTNNNKNKIENNANTTCTATNNNKNKIENNKILETSSTRKHSTSALSSVTIDTNSSNNNKNNSNIFTTITENKLQDKVLKKNSIISNDKITTALQSNYVGIPIQNTIRILFTRIEESTYAKYLTSIRNVTITSDPKIATHCITTKELKRTPKLLIAINSGVQYIVSEKWIIDMIKAESVIDIFPNKINDLTNITTIKSKKTNNKKDINNLIEQQLTDTRSDIELYNHLKTSLYIIRDYDKEKLWRFNMALTLSIPRSNQNNSGLFKNIYFYCTKGVCEDGIYAPKTEEMREIVESGGGFWLDKLDITTTNNNNTVSNNLLHLIILSHEAILTNMNATMKKQLIDHVKKIKNAHLSNKNSTNDVIQLIQGIYAVEMVFLAVLRQKIEYDQNILLAIK